MPNKPKINPGPTIGYKLKKYLQSNSGKGYTITEILKKNLPQSEGVNPQTIANALPAEDVTNEGDLHPIGESSGHIGGYA